jgi:two-component system CheB/CheR fusion protein
MNDGTLVLSDVNGYQERRAPIDIFFRTLADTHDSRAVCAVMSGSGADGSMGLRRVKEYSGLVLVQDPAEAAFDDMPRHCIATGLVDFVVPVGEMPRRILEYRDQIAAIHIPEDPNERAADDDHALKEVFSTLRLRTGHDFTNYKRATVLRRIERRIAVRNLSTLPEYADFLRERHDESHALLRELLISVTNFFRDPVGLGPRREAPDPEADREEAVRRSPARLGSGLRDGGGGVHDRHAPRRACLIGRPDFRDRSRRARHRPRAQRLVQQGRGRGRAARAFAPLFSQRTGRISHPPRAARDGAVRASQRH